MSHKRGGKHTVTVHRAPHGWKAYIQWGAAWFPRRIVYYTAVSTPVLCSLQRDIFHLGLGRPESRYPVRVLVTLYMVSPPHTCYCLPCDPGNGSARNPEVRMRGWIYGRRLSVFPLSSDKVENEWSYTFILLYTFMVWKRKTNFCYI
jgi:hypothetical protein